MLEIDWLRTEYIAHRGFHNLKEHIPENSMLAFQKAIECGYGIECDIRLTKDNQVIVFHDKQLTRLCGVDKLVESSTYEELKQHKLLNSNEEIPLLHDLVKLVSCKVPLLIEIKTDNNAKNISKALHDIMQNYHGLYAIQSFDPRAVLWFKKHSPSTIRGQIAQLDVSKKNNVIVRFLTDRMALNILTKPHFINYKISDMPLKILDILHNKNVPILAFTAKSQEDFDFVLEHYDNAVFEGFHPKK